LNVESRELANPSLWGITRSHITSSAELISSASGGCARTVTVDDHNMVEKTHTKRPLWNSYSLVRLEYPTTLAQGGVVILGRRTGSNWLLVSKFTIWSLAYSVIRVIPKPTSHACNATKSLPPGPPRSRPSFMVTDHQTTVFEDLDSTSTILFGDGFALKSPTFPEK
jgi:hypothetical protein